MSLFYIITILLSALIFFITILFIAQNSKKKIPIFFFFVCFGIVLWFVSVSLFKLDIFSDSTNFILLIISYLGINIIPTSIILFINFVSESKSLFFNRVFFVIASIPFLIFVTIFSFDINSFAHSDLLFYTFLFYVFSYLSISLGIFYKILSYRKVSRLEKAGGFLWVSIFSALIMDLILVNYFKKDTLFFVTVGVVFCGIFYATFIIFKNYKWSLKIIATELFIILVVVTLLVQTLMFHSSVLNNIVNLFVFISFVLAGYFLIRNVKGEVSLKNEARELALELEGKNKRLKQLDNKKSAFVGMSAHLLKDPLTAIKGYASMLIEGSFGKRINKRAKTAISNIYESSERLVFIIEDFMDISNIESGTMDYVFEKTDLNEIVRSIILENKQIIRRSGLEVIHTNFNDEQFYPVNIDNGKIRQVLSNLLDNALKYTLEGTIILTLFKNVGKNTIVLEIKDTGIGLTTKTIQRLFQKFSRAEGVQKLNTDGSGLGLFVAKEILKKHDGKIWVKSKGLNKGSSFYIELPEVL